MAIEAQSLNKKHTTLLCQWNVFLNFRRTNAGCWTYYGNHFNKNVKVCKGMLSNFTTSTQLGYTFRKLFSTLTTSPQFWNTLKKSHLCLFAAAKRCEQLWRTIDMWLVIGVIIWSKELVSSVWFTRHPDFIFSRFQVFFYRYCETIDSIIHAVVKSVVQSKR